LDEILTQEDVDKEGWQGSNKRSGHLDVPFDDLGAGVGSLIAFSEGREAAQPFDPGMMPIDAYNAAILDSVTVNER